MLSLPGTLIEAVTVLGVALGLLILAAPSLGCKPKRKPEGWHFPVKFTCHLLHMLALLGGVAAVDLASHVLASMGLQSLSGWALFACGVAGTLLVITDWPEPLVLDQHGMHERGSRSGQIRWTGMKEITAYRVRYDRGLVVHGHNGEQLTVADLVYDSEAVLRHLRGNHDVPYQPLTDEAAPITLFAENGSRLAE